VKSLKIEANATSVAEIPNFPLISAKNAFSLQKSAIMTTLVRISTSQVDIYDLRTGKIRQIRDRRFVNNCVITPWTAFSYLITGFDSPEGEALLLHSNTMQIQGIPRLIQGRKFHSGVKFQEKTFLMGGYTHQLVKLRTCESFNGRKWTKEADMVESRSGFSSVATSTAIFALGDNTSRSIERFDGTNWRLLPFHLLYNTQNLCLTPLQAGEILVIGGGSAVTGACNEIRVQALDSEDCVLIDKLPVSDYFRCPPVEYQGNWLCIGQKGVHERRPEGWILHSKDRFCGLCGRWRCDSDCKWVRRRAICMFYQSFQRLKLI